MWQDMAQRIAEDCEQLSVEDRTKALVAAAMVAFRAGSNDKRIEAPIERLSRDLKDAARTLSRDEARFLVDEYYTIQANRIREDAQVRSLSQSGEPHDVLRWFSRMSGSLEDQMKIALDRYSGAQPIGVWARSHLGIGPVIAAGLIAHIDIHKAETASDIWSFAGLNPSARWEKGQKRPWNASLKVLCWKLGESFVKVSGNADAFYGQLYKQRKDSEVARNEAGDFAAAARAALAAKRFRDDTTARKCYEAGKLPPAHVHARARRYAVKIFLSHFHGEWRRLEGLPVREPYAVAILGHGHLTSPPQPE